MKVKKHRHVTGLALGIVLGVVHSASAVQESAEWIGSTGNWNLAANWDIGTVPNNGVDSYLVFIDGGNASGSVVSLDVLSTIDGLTIDLDDMLNINNGITLTILNAAGLTNNGTLNLNSTSATTTLLLSGNQTIAGSGTVVLGNSTNFNRLITTTNSVLTNNALHTIRGQGQLLANIGGMINDGSIIADQASALVIDPSTLGFTNNNILQATGTGGLEFAPGTFNNNANIEITNGSKLAMGGSVNIVGGTLKTTGSGQVLVSTNGNTLDGVTLDGTINISNGIQLNIDNGLTNNGTINLNSSNGTTTLDFDDVQTLGGTGVVILGTGSTFNRITTNGTLLTHGADHTIRGQGNILANTGGMINNGTIIADQAEALIIDPGALGFNNNGTLKATGTGGLQFNTGTFTLTGTTVEIASGSQLNLAGSITVIEGTLQTTGTGVFNNNANGNTLDGVTLDGTMNISNGIQVAIKNGLTNNGTVNLNSTNANTTLDFDDAQTLGGTGEVILGSGSSFNRITTNGTLLTHGADHTIRGQGNILANTGGMINNGSIIADQAVTLIIDPGALGFTNSGTLEAIGTGGLRFNGGTYTLTGTTVEIKNGSSLDLAGSITVVGGTLQTTGTGVVSNTANGNTLDAVTLDGTLNISNGIQLNIDNGLTNNGTINLNSSNSTTTLDFNDAQTLGGTGEVILGSGSTLNRITTNGTVLTHGANHTIRGQGQLLAHTGGMINNGTIIADTSSAIIIDPNANGFTNNGLVRAQGTGGISLSVGTFNNNSGGVLRVDTTMSISTGSVLNNNANGIIMGNGTITTLGSGVINQMGVISPGNSAGMLTIDTPNLTFAGSSDLRIEIGGLNVGTQYDRLAIDGNALLGGDLELVLINGFTTDTIGQTWTILTTTGTLTGTFLNAPNDLDLLVTPFATFEVDYTANSVILTNTTTIIPEPTSLALLGINALILLRRRRNA